MESLHIGLELRALGNAIRRYFEYSTHSREVRSATGNNKLIIHYLSDNAGKDIYQKDIETHFNVARSTASKVLKLMEQKGMIEKQSVAQDARLKRIVLTEEAQKIQGLMREDAENMEQTLTRGFSDEELKTLLGFLLRMRANLSD